jgi:hypothetical protein
MVDSRPVAQGVGTAWVRVPPGVHRVSIQAGGLAGWWTADVRAGGVTALESHPERAWKPGLELPLAPGRFAEKIRYWTILWYLPAAFAGALLLLAIPGCLVGVFAPGILGSEPRTVVSGALAAVALVLFAVMALRHIGTMRSTKQHLRLHTELASSPARTAYQAFHLPPGIDRIPAEAGTGGLLLDLTWETVWQRIESGTHIDWLWMQYSGEPGPVHERPWMTDPVVAVDGVEQRLDWGRWWVPLEPGEHLLEVAVPKKHPGRTGGDRLVRWRGNIDTAEEWYTRVRLDARAVQHTEVDRATLSVTGFDAEIKSHMSTGRLPEFREPRIDVEPLDGQTDVRLRHSVNSRSVPDNSIVDDRR